MGENDLVTHAAGDIAVGAEKHSRSDDARAYQREALAESTRRNYAAHIAAWEAYCAEVDAVPYPADATVLANYLAARATDGRRAGRRHGTGVGQALGTIRLAYVAIRVAHRLNGVKIEDPQGAVHATLRGIRRVNGARESQVKALRGQLIVQCAPNQSHPSGVDIDMRHDADEPSCLCDLPYPARRCGVYVVECSKCASRVVVTTPAARTILGRCASHAKRTEHTSGLRRCAEPHQKALATSC